MHPSKQGPEPKPRFEPPSSRYPLLPLKNVVIFPRNIVTLLVGRSRSIQAVEEALTRDHHLVVTAHREGQPEEPKPDDLSRIGTLARIAEIERPENGQIQVVLEGVRRVEIADYDSSRPFFTVAIDDRIDGDYDPLEAAAFVRHVKELTTRFSETSGRLTADVLEMASQATEPGHLADLLATQLLSEATALGRRQRLLEERSPLKRLEEIAVHLSHEIENALLEQKIKTRVREQIDKNQREYFLREQLRAIHDELSGEHGNEIETLRGRITDRGLPDEVRDKLLKDLSRLERMPPVSAEATVVRTYMDALLGLPWHEQTQDCLDLAKAQAVLDADHFGLEHVKERILDYLAVRKLTVDARSTDAVQILCLAGPPGVGKTSLGRSIASSMGRNFVRVSLGGVRDEADIRGHRRTYIGAMPGRIINAMKSAGTVNPLVLLDEIDKLAADYRGDPSAAMLEVLDPEQNNSFTDHYLDVPYDLSSVLFITTANTVHQIPRPLRDRMEIIDISGYTETEKVEIGRRYLLPKQLKAHGLASDSVVVPESMWPRIVREYTREAGVRGLDREVATLCRKLARDTVSGRLDGDGATDDGTPILTETRLERYLGPRKWGADVGFGDNLIGVAMGLGTTDAGGELIPVEVANLPGRGNLTITGRAGDVMQESARAALSYARSRAEQLHISPDFQEKMDLHIHLPEGATPKDGPSAGITMATALISALVRQPVRSDTAMTGEITLRGRVLAIGGLKDKTLAAHRHGIRRVIAPAENRRDLVKIPAPVVAEMEFVFVSTMDEVLTAAFTVDPTATISPIPPAEATAPAIVPSADGLDIAI